MEYQSTLRMNISQMINNITEWRLSVETQRNFSKAAHYSIHLGSLQKFSVPRNVLPVLKWY